MVKKLEKHYKKVMKLQKQKKMMQQLQIEQ